MGGEHIAALGHKTTRTLQLVDHHTYLCGDRTDRIIKALHFGGEFGLSEDAPSGLRERPDG